MITLIFIILLDFSPSTKEGFSFSRENMPKDFGISSSSFSGKSLKMGGDNSNGEFGEWFGIGKNKKSSDSGDKKSDIFSGVGIGKNSKSGDKKSSLFGGFGGGKKEDDDKKGGMFSRFGGGKKEDDDKKSGILGMFGGKDGEKEPKPNNEQETNISGTSSVKTNKITGTTTINIYTNQ